MVSSQSDKEEPASLIELPCSAIGAPLPSFDVISPTASRIHPVDQFGTFHSGLPHTDDHANCPACIEADRALQGVEVDFATLRFSNIDKDNIDQGAAGHWMRLREQSTSLKQRTHDATQGHLDAMAKFFGALRLCDITPGHIRGYQIARLQNVVRSAGRELHPWKFPAGHSLVNHEISALAQILRHCKLWQRIQPFYFPLAVKQWSPRTILTEDEEQRLFEIAAKHPEASLAYWVAVITNNTTASGIELRGLRLKHLFLPAEGIAEIYVPEDSVKNNSRPRKIALNPTARWAIEQCYKRALKLGCCEPDHYLFPFRVIRNQFDPARQASRSWLRKSWDKLRAVTGFTALKPHDLRHNCITRLLENDVAPETVRAIAGHVTPKMMEYYAHHRTRVQYAAVLAIESKKRKTVAVSGQNKQPVSESAVLERRVRV